MFADAIATMTHSIFPIFFAYEQDERLTIGVSGTGFFVNRDGLFVTVHHIMHCAPADATYYYYGNVPDQVCEPAVEIEHVASDPARDLYLGRIRRDAVQPVEFSREAVRPGDFVCLSGYPMAVIGMHAQGALVGNVRRYWQPTHIIDVTEAVIDGRTYDGHLVGHACLPGMSGGPVFDATGNVRGMGVATLTRTIPELAGAAGVVTNGIMLASEHLRGFIEQHRPSVAARS